MDQVLFARIVCEQCGLTHDLFGGAKRQLTPSVILVCSIDGTSRGATFVSRVIEHYKHGTNLENACHLVRPTGLFRK
jgi:hypothetical protein